MIGVKEGWMILPGNYDPPRLVNCSCWIVREGKSIWRVSYLVVGEPYVQSFRELSDPFNNYLPKRMSKSLIAEFRKAVIDWTGNKETTYMEWSETAKAKSDKILDHLPSTISIPEFRKKKHLWSKKR